MNVLNRPGIHKTGKQMLDNELVASNPLVLIIKLFVRIYTALVDLMIWAKMMRARTRPLNELTLEGLYLKDLEIVYFDFFDQNDWEKTKEAIRSLMTSIVLGSVFYLLATHLMNLDLRVRVIATCIVCTLLTLLLSVSPASRAVTFLMIPSMSRDSLRSAVLVGSVVLLAAGPGLVLRNNLDAVSSSKSCLHEQYFDIVSVVKSLHGKGVVNLLIIPVRLLVAALQIVGQILFQMLLGVIQSLEKLIRVMQNLFKQLDRMVDKFKALMSPLASCKGLTRRLSVKFQRTKVLFGIIQMGVSIINFFRSLSSTPPVAVPTIGYLIHEIGNKICPKLRKAQQMYNEKKQRLKDWLLGSITSKINKVKAIKDLVEDAIGPDTRVTIEMTGGVSHQLNEVKNLMREAVSKKTAEVKEVYSTASHIAQIVSSVLCLVVFGVSLLLSIRFYQGYMTKDSYQNNYITAPFLRLEEIEPPLLPLDEFEKSRVSILAEAMISDIVRRLGGSDLFMTLLRLLPFILVIIFQWLSYIITQFMENTWNKAIEIERSLDTRLSLGKTKHDANSNPMALLIKVIIEVQGALRSINLDVNVLACSPKATSPNWAMDVLLGLLLVLYTSFTLFSPFLLKLRHHIMLGLEPTRSVQRAVWLRREIQADRELLPAKRDLFRLSQMERENSSMLYLFHTYVTAQFSSIMDSLRSLFNLPTIRCAQCGVRGNLSMKNFNDFFTVCDSCESSICAPCAHFTDEEGVIRLRNSCPNCGLKMEDVEIDAEEIDDEDPLNDMLYNFLDLTPGYKVSKSALEAQRAAAKAYKEELEQENERSFITALGSGVDIDTNEKKT